MVTNSKEGESLSLQDVDGVFLQVPTSKDMLKTTTFLSDREASVPSLMTGSLRTSSDGETSSVVFDTLLFQEEGEFRVEEENMEKVLKLMQQALQESKAKLQESQSEVVNLQLLYIVHQQQISFPLSFSTFHLASSISALCSFSLRSSISFFFSNVSLS